MQSHSCIRVGEIESTFLSSAHPSVSFTLFYLIIYFTSFSVVFVVNMSFLLESAVCLSVVTESKFETIV